MSNESFMPPAKRRFYNAIAGLREIGRVNLTREEQENIAHTINRIESYGFDFIPNHYVMDDVLNLESFVEEKKNAI